MPGCCTPPPLFPPPPPRGIRPRLACCCSRLSSGACGLFGWPRPPVGGSVFYRGMVWLLPLVSSNVIVTCLVPSRLVWGSVYYRGTVWLLPLVSTVVRLSLRARYHTTKFDVVFCLQMVPLSLL